MEVIEHIDPPRLAAFEQAVFGWRAARHRDRRPRPTSSTTCCSPGLPAGELRHGDHRFEWTRAAVRGSGPGKWPRGTATAVELSGIGPDDAEVGRADAAGGVPPVSPITIPELSPRRRWSASPAPGSRRSRARTSRRPRSLSSDFCRGLVSDDENDQAATADAFEVLHFIAAKRLAAGRLTVVDATSVQRRRAAAPGRAGPAAPRAGRSRSSWTCPRASARPGTRPAPTARSARTCCASSTTSSAGGLRGLRREGFHRVHVLSGTDEIDAAVDRARAAVERPARRARAVRHHRRRARLLRRADRPAARPRLPGGGGRDVGGAPAGPHGRLRRRPGRPRARPRPPCCGWSWAWPRPAARCRVPGNHEDKLVRALRGRDVTSRHGLAESLAQLAAEPAEFTAQATAFMDGLLGHLVLDDGRLVVAHAGLPEAMHGRASAAVAVVRALRRHDRRDRRVRAAGPLPVGAGLPGPRDGGLRAHAGARRRVGQRHHLPGHRLRVRRQADRAALPGARDRQSSRPGRSTTSRSGRSPRRPRSRPRAEAELEHRPTCSASGSWRPG